MGWIGFGTTRGFLPQDKQSVYFPAYNSLSRPEKFVLSILLTKFGAYRSERDNLIQLREETGMNDLSWMTGGQIERLRQSQGFATRGDLLRPAPDRFLLHQRLRAYRHPFAVISETWP